MIFEQFYLESLGHASYFIGSEETGEALVLDVRRDVDTYFAEARDRQMRIAYACDTHQHNDYVTGICELPRRGEVKLLAGARAELGYKVRPMDDGQRLEMGEVVFEFLHTPGHTPEHISLLVTDRSRGEEPALLFSGGALLVGDLARPDLLGGEEETRRNAEMFCHTLQEKILTLPDFVEVYPTHVAGSLCGGSIGSRLSTTIGYERRMNQLLRNIADSDEFVGQCLELKNLPAVPPYWPRMRKMNTEGPPPLGVLADPPPLDVEDFDKLRHQDAVVVDCRSPEAFAAHIPGALNVGAGNAFPTWAGSVLPPDQPLLLVLDKPEDLWNVCWELLRIGYDLPQGWLAGGMFAWRTAGRPIEVLPQWTVNDLHEQLDRQDGLIVLDVRQPAEWVSGHIPGAVHITGAELPEREPELPKDKPIATICGSGYRSSVAASLLKRRGHTRVFNVLGGMIGWQSQGMKTTSETR
ncbi:MAG TPA: rhodanese-like domain-containing protein [Thiohalobacter sp.]|nr:rhodanese-like domain-containing protein [Thiohalobacter sp.]